MKYSKRFENATQALVSAFLNDTLAKGSCTACAVGNIVAHGMGAKIEVRDPDEYIEFVCNRPNYHWAKLFCTSNGVQDIGIPYNENFREAAIENIEATGYSQEELMRVEYAFEVSTKIDYLDYPWRNKPKIMEDQHKGLMAVMDVLFDIEGIQEEDRKEYIELFQKCK